MEISDTNYDGSINNGFSSHGQGLYGNATLRGSFYNPNFLNFSIAPYADRDQANSLYGALSNSTGINANVNLFSGSHFPGSVYFGRGSDSSSEFGLPSSSVGLATHGTTPEFRSQLERDCSRPADADCKLRDWGRNVLRLRSPGPEPAEDKDLEPAFDV